MFDIGFWEIVLIAVIALIVVGPERFPGMVRTAGYWFGRAKEMASSVKYELEKEVDKAEKLQELINKQVLLEEQHRKEQEQREKASEDGKPVPVAAKPPGTHVDEQLPPVVNDDARPAEGVADNKVQDKAS